MKKQPIKHTLIIGTIITSILTAGASAMETGANETPYTIKNGEWITVKGTVTSVSLDTFMLDYGTGAITVEMDDYDKDHEAQRLFVDDEVSVTGRIDADYKSARSIEASEVFVAELNHSFYANADDEEEVKRKLDQDRISAESLRMVRGTIVDFLENGYLVQTDAKRIKVITTELSDETINKITYKKDIGQPIRFVGLPGDGHGTASSLIAIQHIE